MSLESFIEIEVEQPIAHIRLNRAAKLNALTLPMLDDLAAAVEHIDADSECRLLLLSAAGDKAFCAGADINAWSQLTALDMWRQWIRRGHQVFERLARLRQPSIALIQGIAYGGGLELALACDLRIAVAQAKFALPEVSIGTIPGWAGSQRLPALIGSARAKQMIFSAAPIDAQTAEHWGLINEVVSSQNLLARGYEIGEQIAANAPLAVQASKQLIDANQGLSVSMSLEALASALTTASADGDEGLRAFRERRPAKFTGR